jgi:RNA polymerase sigma-70 factor (ECF subfamily)
VFLVVRKRLPTFEGRSSLRTWIYGICIRVVSDYRSRAFRRREVSHEHVPDVLKQATQHTATEQRQLQQRLNALLAALPDEQRDVFVLYEMEELTMKEVAEIIDCPIQTAYSRLHAARDALKAKLQAEGITP